MFFGILEQKTTVDTHPTGNLLYWLEYVTSCITVDDEEKGKTKKAAKLASDAPTIGQARQE